MRVCLLLNNTSQIWSVIKIKDLISSSKQLLAVAFIKCHIVFTGNYFQQCMNPHLVLWRMCRLSQRCTDDKMNGIQPASVTLVSEICLSARGKTEIKSAGMFSLCQMTSFLLLVNLKKSKLTDQIFGDRLGWPFIREIVVLQYINRCELEMCHYDSTPSQTPSTQTNLHRTQTEQLISQLACLP